MTKKQIIKTVIILVSIIAILAVIEIVIKSLYDTTEKTISEYKYDKQSESADDSQYAEVEEINDLVGEFTIDLESRNYEKLYSRIDSSYKDYKYTDFGNFKEYIDSIVPEGTKIDVISKSQSGITTVALIRFSTNGETVSRYIKVFRNEDETYSFIFDDVVSIKKMAYSAESGFFKCVTVYEVTYAEKVSYVLEITNTTKNNNISVNKDRTFITFTDTTRQFNKVTTSEIEGTNNIKPGETKRIELVYELGEEKIYSGQVMNLSVKVGKDSYKYTIQIVEDEEDGLLSM